MGSTMSRQLIVAVPRLEILKRRECPQDYMVEHPAKSREARVRFPVPRKRDSSVIVLQPIVASLPNLIFEW